MTGAVSRLERGGRVLRFRTDYELWLDERDARPRAPLTRADLRSKSDDRAAKAVADGGGIQAVIEATGLRTLENVLTGIDPEILDRRPPVYAGLPDRSRSVQLPVSEAASSASPRRAPSTPTNGR